MPRLPTIALALPLLIGAASHAPLPASTSAPTSARSWQDAAALDALLGDQLAAAAGLSPLELWQRASGLRELAAGGPEGEWERVLDARIARASELGREARVLLAAARLQAASPSPDAIHDLLLPLLSGPADALCMSAASTLGQASFKKLAPDKREPLLARLLELAQDASLEPELRITCASAAFRLGTGSDRRAARGAMLDFRASSDAELSALGALALADAGDEINGLLAEQLERIAQVPGEQGLRAAAYLKQEDLRRLGERKLKNLADSVATPAASPGLARITEVMQMVHGEHIFGDKFDDEELYDAALDGMLGALDEHSTYMEPEFFRDFSQELEAEYGGIGAYVGEDRSDGLFTITRPIYSGPAYKAGIHTDDKIVRIDDWPTIGKTTEEIIKRLKGKPGTQVKLYVWRRGMDPDLIDRPTDEMVVSVERARIEIPSVATQILPGKVALVELKEFSRVASHALEQELKQLREQGIESLVLDLRRNPGGLLTEAVAVAGLFLPRGSLVVSTESRSAPPTHLRTDRNPILPAEFPVVVLTNRFSASASEIVAGALQDHERALLVGERSFGKGSVQQLLAIPGALDERFVDENRNGRFDNWERFEDANGNGEFDYAPRVKLTVAQYRLPSGRSIHREIDKDKNLLSEGGIAPDMPVELPRIDAWRIEEAWRVRGTRKLREYVEQHWLEHAALLRGLAEFDGKDASKYPGFDEFYASLETVLPKDDVRLMLREEVRRRVQDERGAAFPLGDFQEDVQLQEAVRASLEERGVQAQDVPEYAACFRPTPSSKEAAPVIAARSADPAEVTRMLGRLEDAKKEGGRLSSQDIERVIELLSSSEASGEAPKRP